MDGSAADTGKKQNWEHRKRPFDDIEMDKRQEWGMKIYEELKVVGEDGFTFENKTAFMIAYERMLESERPEGERLFNDYLAKHFCQGDLGKLVSDMLANGLKVIFDPTDEIGLGYEGHVNYTAARTQLISDKMKAWIEQTEGKKQVLDMGVGVTTRVYWDESLKSVDQYIEVDQKAVMDAKQKVLDELQSKGELKDPMCPRTVISMNFKEESTKDLPKHGFDESVPTCWILEGLIMYLTKEVNEQMFAEISALSAKGSYIIVNFFHGSPVAAGTAVDEALTAAGWTKEQELMFGDETFNYGKYPEGKPANKNLGFSMFKK